MMSETAFFVKDVIGPKGSVSIVMAETAGNVKSDDINAPTKTNQILWRRRDAGSTDRNDFEPLYCADSTRLQARGASPAGQTGRVLIPIRMSPRSAPCVKFSAQPTGCSAAW